MHLAAADVTGRVAILEGREIAPGESGLVQIVLDEPIGALWGDRLILRISLRSAPSRAAPSLIRFHQPVAARRPERIETVKALELKDAGKSLTRLLDNATAGVDLEPFARSRNLTPNEASDLWRDTPMQRVGRAEAPIGVSQSRWETLSEEAVSELGAWHKSHPGDPGPTEDQLRRRMPVRISTDLFAALLLGLINTNKIARDGATLRLPTHRAAMSDEIVSLGKSPTDDGRRRSPTATSPRDRRGFRATATSYRTVPVPGGASRDCTCSRKKSLLPASDDA